MIIGIIPTSCTIQKRLHLPGYHVEWNYKYNQSNNEPGECSLQKYDLVEKPVHSLQQSESTINSEKKVNVSDVSVQSSIDMSVEQKKHEKTLSRVVQPVKKYHSYKLNATRFTKLKKPTRQTDDTTEPAGKSQLTALILAIFAGALGIHRFYLGYTGMGILMILTLGGCGILMIIDIVKIANGTLKPKNGEYSKKMD